MKGQLGGMLQLFFIAIMFFVFAYITTKFLIFLPLPKGAPNTLYSPLYAIYNAEFVTFDNSFLFIFVIILFLDVLVAYYRPSKRRGIINIFLLFGVVFFGTILNTAIIPLNLLGFASLLPNTYAFFTNGYYIVVTFFMLILAIIFDFRDAQQSNTQNAYNSDQQQLIKGS